MDYQYTVYKTINNLDGMFYIGVHKTKNVNDMYFGSGLWLKRAIRKYGKENFTKQILFIFSNPEEAYLKEIELLTQELINSQLCYNMREGGHGGWTECSRQQSSKRLKELWNDPEWKLREIERRRISSTNFFNDPQCNHPFKQNKTEEWKQEARTRNLGKQLSEETRKKISESLQGRKPHGFKHSEASKEKMRLTRQKKKSEGYKHSDETKEKMRLKRLGVKKSEEHKAKISEANKKFYSENPPKRLENGKFISD